MSFAFFARRARTVCAIAVLATTVTACSKDDPEAGEEIAGEQEDDEESDGKTTSDAGRKDGAVRSDSGRGQTGSNIPPPKPDDGSEKCAGIRKDAPEAQGGVDVVFVIDTSGSMLPVIEAVKQNMGNFMRDFEGSDADTHVVVITERNVAMGTSLENDATRYRFVPSEVDSSKLYTVALAAFPLYGSFLRPGAATQFVMVTDDEDDISADAFHQQMRALLGHDFVQHAIASEDVNGRPCAPPIAKNDPLCVGPIPFLCSASAIGRQYYSLAATTGGETLSICADDWAAVFQRLSSAVIAGVPLPCTFPLAEATSTDFDPSLVQVVYSRENEADQEFPRAMGADRCASNRGWYYDNETAPSALSLCPAACEAVAAGGALDIAFGCRPTQFL